MATTTRKRIRYPSSDGKPMAENTLQFEWIVTVKEGVESVYRQNPLVFVAGDLLWYPVEGEPQINQAPDTMVVFGRPKRHRPSYLQWREDGIAPQVTFEILSHSNTPRERRGKLDFYDTYGVEEYYEYDPYKAILKGWRRVRTAFRRIPNIEKGWTSPRLNVRFEMANTLILYGPHNRRFLTYQELDQQRIAAEERAERAESRAELEAQRAAEAEARAAEDRERLARMQALMRQHGINPENGPTK